MMKTENISSKT